MYYGEEEGNHFDGLPEAQKNEFLLNFSQFLDFNFYIYSLVFSFEFIQ